jgi:predicted ABC-type ATPase
LNIIAGPNEAGKSTYALALRAAFLERYSTSKVADPCCQRNFNAK